MLYLVVFENPWSVIDPIHNSAPRWVHIFTLIIFIELRNRLPSSFNSDMTTAVTFRRAIIFRSAVTYCGKDANKSMEIPALSNI